MTYFQVGSGDVVGSNHMNTAINQGIPPFATAAARDAAIPSPAVGQHCCVNDLAVSISGLTQRYNGTVWEVIAGDTGWCTVTELLINGWTGGVMIRRTGSVVFLKIHNFVTVPAGFADSSILLNPIPGFTSAFYNDFPTTTWSGKTPVLTHVWESEASFVLRITGNGVIASGTTLHGSFSYITDESWPTVLP
jgi:hypothetical protein